MNRRSLSLDPLAARPGGPVFEHLEPRTLLSGLAPQFATVLYDVYWVDQYAKTVGVDGHDPDSTDLTVTALSDNPLLEASLINRNDRYARMRFTAADGTVIGDIVAQIFETRAPTASQRFITLATNHVNPNGSLNPAGVPFYTDVVVHRVIPNFVVQTGDAANGDGTGESPLPDFADAYDPDLSFDGVGVLGFAKSGPDTNNCQFYITHGPAGDLNQGYVIFGQMISGRAVLDYMVNLPADDDDRPLAPPVMEFVEIFSSGQDATVVLKPLPGFTGQATVTIRLADPQGNFVEKQIIVRPNDELMDELDDRPEIDDPDPLIVSPGTPQALALTATDDNALPVQWSTHRVPLETTVAVGSLTGQGDVEVPADYEGVFTVKVFAHEAGYADLVPAEATFQVVSLGADQHWVEAGEGASVMRALRDGDTLYLACASAGVTSYDVSDPDDPVLLDTYDTGGSAWGLARRGTTLFVADTTGGLVVLNVADPADVQLIAVIPVSSVAVDVVLDGTTAFVPDYEAGLAAYNVANPNNVTKLGSISEVVPGGFIAYAVAVALKDDYAFLVDAAGGLFVLDVSNPAQMKFVTSVATGGLPWGLQVVGDYLCVADQQQGLLVYDVRKPKKPKLVGTLPSTDALWQVAGAGQVAVVAGNSGVSFVDLADPANPAVEYTFHSSGGAIPSIQGSEAFMPLGPEGLVFQDAAEYVNRLTVTKKLTFTATGNVEVTLSVKSGTAVLHTTIPGGGDVERLEFDPDSGSATLKISTKGGAVVLGDVHVLGGMKSFDAKGATVTGDMTFDNAVGTLTLGDVADDHTITIGPRLVGDTKTEVKMTLGRVSDTSVLSLTPIKSLTVIDWRDLSGAADLIQAAYLGKLTTKGNKSGAAGDFQADLDLNGPAPKGGVLGSAKIAGNLQNALWDITGDMGKLTVTGRTISSTVRATGNMDKMTLGTAEHADFLAGINAAADRRADDPADFQSLRQIKGVSIKGPKLPSGTPMPTYYFLDSNFSSASFGSVSLTRLQPDNGGTEFGFFALDDGSGNEMKSVKYSDKTTGEKWTFSSQTAKFLGKGDLTIVCYSANPMLTYSVTTLTGGLFGLTFRIRGNDGQEVSFFADVTFEGSGGATIRQQQVILAPGAGLDVNSDTNAATFQGMGAPPYDQTRDSYFIDPFASSLIGPGIVQGANSYSIVGGTGAGSAYQEADLAYIVSSGLVHYSGTISRLGTNYPVDGIAVV